MADQSALERLTTKRVQLEGDIAELTSEVEEWQRKASKVSNRLKARRQLAWLLGSAHQVPTTITTVIRVLALFFFYVMLFSSKRKWSGAMADGGSIC